MSVYVDRLPESCDACNHYEFGADDCSIDIEAKNTIF